MAIILPRVENLTIDTKRNEWGWYWAGGWIGESFYRVKFDHKPTQGQARKAIRAFHNTFQGGPT